MNGVNYDAELHVVFEVDPDDKDKAGQYTLAVTGFFLDSSSDTKNDFISEWNLNR